MRFVSRSLAHAPSAASRPGPLLALAVALASTSVGGALVACGDSGGSGEPPLETSPDDAVDRGPNGASSGGAPSFSEAGTVSQTECGEGSREIQVFGSTLASKSLEVWRFAPATRVFTKVADARCEGLVESPTVTPGTGAVDRSGQAYVHLAAPGEPSQGGVLGGAGLFRIDTRTGACTRLPGAPAASLTFGSAFTADAIGGASETWFVPQPKFAAIDPSTLALREIAPSSWLPAGATGQLLGSGDATLRGLAWFPAVERALVLSLSTIDKTTGKASEGLDLDSTPLRGGSAWAFTRWGGEVWGFVAHSGGAPDNSGTSEVLKWDARGAVESVARHPTLRIAAVGASTCAPTAPVR